MENKRYCAAPWKSLHISPQSDIRVCCYGQSDFGNLQTDDINEVMQCEELKKLRDTIKQGKLHETYCSGCIKTEEIADLSERNWHNNIAGDFDCTTVSNDYYAPTLLDLRWNITCNMSCTYCGPTASSKWAKMLNVTELPTPSGKYLDNVLDFISTHTGSIDTVALIGGEPLLLPPNDALLNILPDTVKIMTMTNLSIDVNTNKVYNKLVKRGNVIWTVSFDNIGEQFEYVRYGGKWETMRTNLNELLGKNGDISIMSVYSLYNATRLNEFVSWYKDNNLEANWQILTYPDCLNMLNQPKLKDIALDELTTVLSRPDLTEYEITLFSDLSESLETAEYNDLSSELKQFTKDMELKYHPDKIGQFDKLWPEIAERINE